MREGKRGAWEQTEGTPPNLSFTAVQRQRLRAAWPGEPRARGAAAANSPAGAGGSYRGVEHQGSVVMGHSLAQVRKSGPK